MRPQKKSGRAR